MLCVRSNIWAQRQFFMIHLFIITFYTFGSFFVMSYLGILEKSILIVLLFGICCLSVTLAIFIIFLEAFIELESLYLSLKYITSVIPLCIIILAHSLHGNNATYIEQPLTSAEFLFKIALTSA
jgi:hypothetical protein